MINISDMINKELQKPNDDDLWLGSKNQGWKHLPTPQVKGSLGTKIYKEWLEQQGYEAQIISDQGDIQWRKTEQDSWTKDEVKAAGATVAEIYKGKKNNMITEQIWVNQIRPGQKDWDGVVIVGVYPNHVKIWRKTRVAWDNTYRNLDSVTKGLKHTGQTGDNQLEQVTMIKNSARDNFDEWDCIYTDKSGDRI